jgi:hypothetical protein
MVHKAINITFMNCLPITGLYYYTITCTAYFIPCSGLTGANLKDPLPEGFFPAYKYFYLIIPPVAFGIS